MDTSALIDEGERLQKTAYLLSTTPFADGDPVVGYWGGERSDLTTSFIAEVTRYRSRRHIITVSESLLSELDVSGSFAPSLYEWMAADGDEHTRVETGKTFDSFTCSGIPLFATEAYSFPPFEAVCLYGSEKVANWMSSMGLARHEYWRVQQDKTAGYQEEFGQRQDYGAILDGRSLDAIVGGWHLTWPEDDFYFPAEMTYLIFTLRDAEPWYSVWHSPRTHHTFARRHVS